MDKKLIFNFKADLSRINIPESLNNPFESTVPEIVKIAAKEFQGFIASEYQEWESDLITNKGKMFGVLVVQREDNSYSYLGSISGKLPQSITDSKLIPTTFDDSTDDFFINRGMTELTEINIIISKTHSQTEINKLKEERKLKSLALQQRLFENYKFLNVLGIEKNVIEIFISSSHGSPPSAAGECAAPKLLHYAFKHQLKPIALGEFWVGKSKSNLKKHKSFYPACKDRCRPILEYMLDDSELFKQASSTYEEGAERSSLM